MRFAMCTIGLGHQTWLQGTEDPTATPVRFTPKGSHMKGRTLVHSYEIRARCDTLQVTKNNKHVPFIQGT